VRVFQDFATLDLVSQGRAEIVAGRGSFIESYPLFGYDLNDYDSLFSEKLGLLLKLREGAEVYWSGKHRGALTGQGVYPRPVQNPLPVWLGVGGTPQSFVRAGTLGLPLMVAIIGGEPHRYRSLIDLYRESFLKAGHPEHGMRVGVHAHGFVGDTNGQAADDLYPHYSHTFSKIGRERGWPPMTRARFDEGLRPSGALFVGDADTVAAKLLRMDESLGGVSRVTIMLTAGTVPHAKVLRAIELLGTRVRPAVRSAFRGARENA